jgi:hypothetical protein
MPSGLHRPTQSPFRWALPARPATPGIHTCVISVLLGRALQACTSLPISAVLGHAPKACHTRDTNTHDLCSTGPGPPGLSSWGSTDTQHLHSASLRPSDTPGPRSKSLLFHLSLRPPPVGPWDPTHLPLATGRLQTYLRNTHRQFWWLKNMRTTKTAILLFQNWWFFLPLL